jgi:hypothetical protein
MKYVHSALIALLVLLPAICEAKENCPWLNQATALGVLEVGTSSSLGAIVEVTATACDFTYRDATGFRALRISVEQSKDPIQTLNLRKTECGSGASALPAIGNEAVMCLAGRKRHIHGEEVIGRVRDNVFSVRLLSKNGGPFMQGQALEEKTERVAEQVAGNLF